MIDSGTSFESECRIHFIAKVDQRPCGAAVLGTG